MTQRIGGVVLGILVYALLGCNDQATTPEPAEYLIYLNHPGSGAIYIIDANSLVIVDSIPGIGLVKDMVSSPNGRWLYAQVQEYPTAPNRLLKIDLTDKSVTTELGGFASELTLLAGGQWLLRGAEYCFDYVASELVDPTQLTVKRAFADSMCRQTGPMTGTQVASVVLDASHRIHVTDILTGDVWGSYLPRSRSNDHLSPVATILDDTGERVIVLGAFRNRESWFVVGDLHGDSTLLDRRLVYAQGDIAVSDDGRWAAVTDPSNDGYWDSSRILDIFDLDALAPIEMNGIRRFTSPGQIEFLPGTDILIMTKESSSLSNGPVVIQSISASHATTIHDRQVASGSIGAMGVGIRYRD